MRVRFALLAALCALATTVPAGAAETTAGRAAAAAATCGVPLIAATPPPVSGNCPGIRPGALMTSPSGCTMNFVFRNGPTGTDRYIGTAAHCIGNIGERVHLSGKGDIGTVVFDGWETPYPYDPLDFALVKIHPTRVAEVNPAMCHWGGPVALQTDGPSVPGAVPLVHYGHGIVVGSQKETKARRGLGYAWIEKELFFFGAVAFGDSGSGIMTADGRAAGAIVRITAWGNVATRIDDAIERASAALGVDLQLVTAPLA